MTTSSWSPVFSAFLATAFTWIVTALGAAVVFLIPSNLSASSQTKLMTISLGFAGGVMLAASYFSLIRPALENSEDSKVWYDGFHWIPVAFGMLLGGGFIHVADVYLPHGDAASAFASVQSKNESSDIADHVVSGKIKQLTSPSSLHQRISSASYSRIERAEKIVKPVSEKSKNRVLALSWRRTILLVTAIAIHNAPEGFAVGVAYGSNSPSAFSLAIGIGLQNFPEGLAVSLPLVRIGIDPYTAFWWGQLSGMIEPVCGVLGAIAIVYIQPFLPVALSFAAGCMIWVVMDDLIPETANETESEGNDNSKSNIWGIMIGFVLMMALDVGLG